MSETITPQLISDLADRSLQIYDAQPHPRTYQIPTYTTHVFTYDECDATFDALYPEGALLPENGPPPEDMFLMNAAVKLMLERLKK